MDLFSSVHVGFSRLGGWGSAFHPEVFVAFRGSFSAGNSAGAGARFAGGPHHAHPAEHHGSGAQVFGWQQRSPELLDVYVPQLGALLYQLFWVGRVPILK